MRSIMYPINGIDTCVGVLDDKNELNLLAKLAGDELSTLLHNVVGKLTTGVLMTKEQCRKFFSKLPASIVDTEARVAAQNLKA